MDSYAIYPFPFGRLKIGCRDGAVTLLTRTDEAAQDEGRAALIPYGETRTYGQIAAAVGSPKACRAVGMANHQNPILLAVPCHRVIGTNGRLVGYGAGLDMKEALLALEKSVLEQGARRK